MSHEPYSGQEAPNATRRHARVPSKSSRGAAEEQQEEHREQQKGQGLAIVGKDSQSLAKLGKASQGQARRGKDWRGFQFLRIIFRDQK